MSQLIDDIIAVFSGAIGGILSITKVLILPAVLEVELLPSNNEIIHALIMASACAAAGFVTTRTLAFLFSKALAGIKYLKRKLKSDATKL